MNKFEQYFLGISQADIRQQKQHVRRVRKVTTNMLRAEGKRLIERGFYNEHR